MCLDAQYPCCSSQRPDAMHRARRLAAHLWSSQQAIGHNPALGQSLFSFSNDVACEIPRQTHNASTQARMIPSLWGREAQMQVLLNRSSWPP